MVQAKKKKFIHVQSHKIGNEINLDNVKNYKRKKNYLSFIIMCLCFTAPIFAFVWKYEQIYFQATEYEL